MESPAIRALPRLHPLEPSSVAATQCGLARATSKGRSWRATPVRSAQLRRPQTVDTPGYTSARETANDFGADASVEAQIKTRMHTDVLAQLRSDVQATLMQKWNIGVGASTPRRTSGGHVMPSIDSKLTDRPATTTPSSKPWKQEELQRRVEDLEREFKAARGADVGFEALRKQPDPLPPVVSPTKRGEEAKRAEEPVAFFRRASCGVQTELSPHDDVLSRGLTKKSESDQGGLVADMVAQVHDGLLDQDELEDLANQAESEALDQMLSPHFVITVTEKEIMEAAVAAVRLDLQKQETRTLNVQAGTRKGSLVPKTKGHELLMLSFVPQTVRRCIRNGLINLKQRRVLLETPANSWYQPVLSRFPAAVVFADASGFTKLTEALAKQPHGAEQIGETLNGFFGPLIEIIHKHKGDVLKFSGDALTIIWASDDPAPVQATEIPDPGTGQDERAANGRTRASEALAAAANCCLEIQREIHKFGATPVDGCSLTMHIGVGFGELSLLQVGGLLGRWEFCVAGQALDQIAIAEPLAHSGETVLSPEARELAQNFEFEEVPADCGHAGFAKLLGVREGAKKPTPLSWWLSESNEGLDLRLVKRFLPSAVAQRLAVEDAEKITWPEEMRRVSVVFVSISGLDPHRKEPRDAATKLDGAQETQLLMRLMQRSVYALEGSLNKFLVDDKGALMLVAFGLPPLVHFMDDPTRAVLCAMRFCETLRDENMEGRIGVATGLCWCGVVGSLECREYTVMGDIVNLAARLMGKAPANGILVDGETKTNAARVLDFDDAGELKLKGKATPTRAYAFRGCRRGLVRQRKPLQEPLLGWGPWPSRKALREVLKRHEQRSGVLLIRGSGGTGKTELVEDVRSWAHEQGWSFLAGQNLDPTGIFAVPRLCLQDAYRELVRLASKDSLWRAEAYQLLRSSVRGEENGGIVDVIPQDVATQQTRRGPPSNAELYWILVAMLRRSVGPDEARQLELWAPLLSLVVTQLAFGPRMVTAMQERDEQHARTDRFADICAAVLDGFSKHGSAQGGTMVLLHYRCSSATFRASDPKEFAVARAMADLAMKRRRANPDGEARPLVICLVCRDDVNQQNPSIVAAAEACGSIVDSKHLVLSETQEFVKHVLTNQPGGFDSLSHERKSLAEVLRDRASMTSRLSMAPRPGSTDLPTLDVRPCSADSMDVPGIVISRSSVCQVPIAIHAMFEEPDAKNAPEAQGDAASMTMLSQYVFEVTGGNPEGVLLLLRELYKQRVLVPAPPAEGRDSKILLTEECRDIDWLRNKSTPPAPLMAMAFGIFEKSDTKSQMVLKAASTLDMEFGLWELKAALPEIDLEQLKDICTRLSNPNAHTLRKVVAQEDESSSPRGRRLSFSPSMHVQGGGPSSDRSRAGSKNGVQTDRGSPASDRVSRAGFTVSLAPGSDVASRRPSKQLLLADAPDVMQRRRSEARRASRMKMDRFQFYSLLLRNVAASLVLQSQRLALKRKASEMQEEIQDDDFSEFSDESGEEDYSS